ncbi:MAG: hypothetical protein MI784_13550, partial [Cytophagales bacterium]|nr:hypothetical protein [Cytophagales bacterium]
AKEKEEIAALPFNLQHQLRSNPDIEYGSPDFKEIEKAYYDQVLVDQFKEEQAAKHEAFVEKVESANTAITGQKKYQREISTLTNLDQFWSIVGDAKDDLQIQYAGALLERIISNLADTNAKAYAELVHTMNMQSWPNAIADFVLRITEGTLSGASETELIKLAKNVEAATVGSNIDTIISTLRSRKAPYDVYRAVMVGNEYEPRRTREQWQKFIEE